MAWTVGGSVYFCDFYLSAEGVDLEDLRNRGREHMEKIESKQFWEAFNAGKPTIYSGVGLAPPLNFCLAWRGWPRVISYMTSIRKERLVVRLSALGLRQHMTRFNRAAINSLP